MFEIKAEIIINRPIEMVFGFVSDNENDPQWCVPVLETVRVAGDKPAVGAKYKYVSEMMGPFKARGEFTITAFTPPTHVAWEGRTTVGSFKGSYRLESVNGGTRLVEANTFELKGLFRLMDSKMRQQLPLGYETQLQRLKTLLEAQNG